MGNSLKNMKLRREFMKKNPGWKNRLLTYLHFAALGDVDAAERLIEDQADVNAVDIELTGHAHQLRRALRASHGVERLLSLRRRREPVD